MGCICKLLSVVLFVIRKNGIQYLFQSVLRKTVIHNRICRFQESYCDAVALKAMEIMVEVDKYCLTNPLFQSMITISIYISISLRHTAASIYSTAFADLEISNAKLNKKGKKT